KSDDAEILFGPRNVCLNDAWRDKMQFNAEIASFTGCTKWRLAIKDSSDRMLQMIPFNLNRHEIFQADAAPWAGNNIYEELVKPNWSYYFTLQVEDKMGRRFETERQSFYVRIDTLRHQERHVFLCVFDNPEPEPGLQFYNLGLIRLADRVSTTPNYRALLYGATCPIGSVAHNKDLVNKRADEHFKKVLSELGKPGLTNVIATKIITPSSIETRKSGGFGANLSYHSPCCCFTPLTPGNDMTVEGRNFNRRIEILLYHDQEIRVLADK
ncbi:hypothetical protein L0128_06290, partial [candidate division KSB1 bacterium]|nr:hypothetical protein [candidate division KSB1 bacterium]